MGPRISLLTLGVGDLERSRRFYVEGLGLSPRPENPDGVVFLATEGTVLALFPRDDLSADATTPLADSGTPPFSLAHNVGSKEEVDAVLAQALAAGAKLVKTAGEAPWGGYTAYFADPDGFLWEIAWNPFMPDLAG